MTPRGLKYFFGLISLVLVIDLLFKVINRALYLYPNHHTEKCLSPLLKNTSFP